MKENEGINVLSTFNGMGCIWLALDKLGVKVNKRYSSEIDKYASIVNNENYPDTIQLGDITKIDAYNLEKIDLIVGGSPCQGFSFAGKQLNFNDPRSKLFFEFVRIYREIKNFNPNVKFLLENVKMKKEYQDVITSLLEVEPIEINSSLVSAQNRKRLYWTNIKGIEQPEDKGLYLKDILLSGYEVGRVVNRRKDEFGIRKENDLSIERQQYFEPRKDSKSGTLTTVPKDNMVIDFSKCELSEKIQKRFVELKENINTNSYIGTTKPSFRTIGQRDIVYGSNQKMGCLTATDYKQPKQVYFEDVLRKLHPIECERLQTVPDNYTASVSNSQRYKMLGNGWTIDVISHILKYEYGKD